MDSDLVCVALECGSVFMVDKLIAKVPLYLDLI